MLAAAQISVPLWTASSWAEVSAVPTWLVAAHDPAGRCGAAIAVEVERSRLLPGHRLLRARNLGAGCLGAAGSAALAGLLALSRSEARVLRLSVEWVLRTTEEQEQATELLRSLGFARTRRPRQYRHTLVIPLTGTEDDLLASFSTTTRRELRQWERRPVEMRTITEVRYIDRLNALSRETFARTGGAWRPRTWADRIAVSTALPGRSRLIGLFREGRSDDEALLAYAWGCAHGEYAQYDDAGSTRVDDIRVSMMYPLMWDLIRWAKANGCTWFDMGGVATSRRPDGDPRAGIAEFKRRFSKELVPVGMEWEFEPHPLRAGVARILRRLARLRG
jgi:hypothetical protein